MTSTRGQRNREAIAPSAAPGLLIKREGDFPAFWPREGSFIEVMDELYGRVRRLEAGGR